jgi:hypothetical protein
MGCKTQQLWSGVLSVSDPSDYDNLGEHCGRWFWSFKGADAWGSEPILAELLTNLARSCGVS